MPYKSTHFLANRHITTREEALERVAYTPAEFAALFGKSATWGYRVLYSGKVKRLEGSKSVLIPKSEVEKFLSRTTAHE